METIRHIFASFDFFGTLIQTMAHSLSTTFQISFLPFYEKTRIFFLDHSAVITGVFGFLLLFSLFNAVQYLTRKRAVLPVRVNKN
jgi:hypothetical protein